MSPLRLHPLPILIALFGTANFSRADQFANFQVGSFIRSLTPGYFATSKTESVSIGTSGNFTTTIFTTGATWETGGPPTWVAVPDAWVEPAYSGRIDGLNVLGFLANPNSTVEIQFNFTSLTNGFLPAGSIIAYNDVDGGEQTTFSSNISSWYSTAPSEFYQVGTNINSPWTTSQPLPGPGSIPSTTGSTANNLVLTGPGVGLNTNGVTNFIVTQVNLSSLSIVAKGSPNMSFAQAVAIRMVPEPSSAMLIGAAGVIGLLRRCRI